LFVSDTLQRRNPLRLIVSRKTQLHILQLVGGGVFFCMACALAFGAWSGQWVWTIALSLGVGAFVSLWVSRKIAGPFYRIEKDLEALLRGASDGRPIQLRPGDPLGHLAELVNELIERAPAGKREGENHDGAHAGNAPRESAQPDDLGLSRK